MRKTDLSPDRQKKLVPLDSHPGALALVPPPTPTHLQLPKLRGEIARAHEALGRLQASAAALPNQVRRPVRKPRGIAACTAAVITAGWLLAAPQALREVYAIYDKEVVVILK